ncbi:Protein CBG27034 [Caenorhabditis briggsae]|uniref:Protein CBG27034 n=1 Tax=Caenorhabditis briggsae TaxID=6238 RepID=B6IM98_CAEBR|nr:Protein CBG27034 [Caenorhabditis briggsae]CAS01028.1 Protein CBG27034 [Caenorhabditis briggsae]
MPRTGNCVQSCQYFQVFHGLKTSIFLVVAVFFSSTSIRGPKKESFLLIYSGPRKINTATTRKIEVSSLDAISSSWRLL